jgi:hypothetical protein
MTLNGPCLLGASLATGWTVRKFFPSNHMRSPNWNLGVSLCFTHDFCALIVTFPPHVTSTSAIEKGKWLEWRDTPERTDSSGSNGLVELDLDLDDEESFIVGRLVSADVIEHETDHAPDYGDYGVISGRLALS